MTAARTMAKDITRDVVIFGGGIAGLWLLDRLTSSGYSVSLFDHAPLGSGQTVASQGMIHGGLKYALDGRPTRASNAVAPMPDRWRACLRGEGEVDLRETRVLSPHYYLWPRGGLRARLGAFLGSRLLRGRVDALAKADFPAPFRDHTAGPLYRLDDPVLDVPSLLHNLSAPHKERIHAIDWNNSEIRLREGGDIEALLIHGHGGPWRFRARRYVIAAGAGTGALLDRFGLAGPAMQRRPLHMVMVRHDLPDALYVHCVDGGFSATPALTITTHPCRGGRVWYLGGGLAESGTGLGEPTQIDRARARMAEYFPWYDLSGARWAGLDIDRAEPAQGSGRRPDHAHVEAVRNCLVCWPTKLTLAPSLAEAAVARLRDQGLAPRGDVGEAAPPLPFPGIAGTPWDEAFS